MDTFYKSIFLAVALILSAHALAQDNSKYGIQAVKDNVYRFTAGHYHSVFMVTNEGILVTDPINEEAAAYLKGELKKRFDLPIRYMVYSHNHVDHILGGKVLADEQTTVVSHEYAAEDIRMTKVPTALPEVTFNDQLTLPLGESRVELRYHGPNNGRGSVSMRFMPANVLFVVDWVVLGRMPYKDLPGYDIAGMIRSTREILNEVPFDTFVGGHAEMGDRKDVQHYLNYLETLYAKVIEGMLAGKSLGDLQKEIRLPAYEDLKMYEEWLPLNIAGVYRTLNDMSYIDRRVPNE